MRIYHIILCIGSLLLMSIGVDAQSETLNIGTVLESTISSGEIQAYQFSALETSIVSISVEAVDNSLDPTVQLLDSSDNLVLKNDDYHYPDSSDALIQAFVIPRTGIYTITISTFGNTSGSYRLSLLPGYDQLTAEDNISDLSNWQPTDSNLMQVSSNENGLFAEIEGISETSNLTASHFPQVEDFYFEATISDIVASTNWQVGIVFRQVTKDLFYRLMMNHQGFWQLEWVNGEDVTVLQSWSTHPAIIPGETSFTLGVLTSGESFDIIYNRQFIATVYDSSIMQGGNVGVTAITANALNSRVGFNLTYALMTTPSQINAQLIFPEILIASNYSSLAHTLERQKIIPVGGETKLTSPSIEIRNVQPGVSRFPVASGVIFSEFVMGGTLTWNTLDAGIGGCGITFNDDNNQNYTLAYINTNGEYGVSQRNGDSFIAGIYGDGLAFDVNSHTFILIVQGNQVHYYINNQQVGKMPYTPISGEISTAVVNFDGVDTTCIIDNLWLWSLDIDNTAP